jgi:hypothetical protein
MRTWWPTPCDAKWPTEINWGLWPLQNGQLQRCLLITGSCGLQRLFRPIFVLVKPQWENHWIPSATISLWWILEPNHLISSLQDLVLVRYWSGIAWTDEGLQLGPMLQQQTHTLLWFQHNILQSTNMAMGPPKTFCPGQCPMNLSSSPMEMW